MSITNDLVQEKILKPEDKQNTLSSQSWNLFVKNITQCSLPAKNGLLRVMQLVSGIWFVHYNAVALYLEGFLLFISPSPPGS